MRVYSTQIDGERMTDSLMLRVNDTSESIMGIMSFPNETEYT